MRLVYSFMFTATLIVFTGCGTSAPEPVTGDHVGDEHAAHDHSGWWCSEHGVPESECALCDTSLVADFKATGDWCEEHNRPESQCFICGPERFEKFAARYEAKFGEAPPRPTE